MEWVSNAQEGVVSRRQLLAQGLSEKQIERLLRRRELAPIHPGIYLSHTGEPSWHQRAWAAFLLADPTWGVGPVGEPGRAALAGPSALRLAVGAGPVPGPNLRSVVSTESIHVAVGEGRRRAAPPGVRLHRTAHLGARVLWSLAPPRVRAEEALMDLVAITRAPNQALGLLADACQARITTAERLRTCLAGRQRMPGRRLLGGALDDLAAGTCSVLEYGYLRHVVRPHGLPAPDRQVRDTSTLGLVFRDAVSGELVVELDGRFFHDNARQRDRDFDRDLDVAAAGRSTVRLTWGQVFERPCATAARLERVLQRCGWAGRGTRCGPTCEVNP